MTEKIYDKDPHILKFDAVVLSCEKMDSHYGVVLDRTAFFPEEGGQGCDAGTLDGQPVLHVSIDKENTLTHLLASPLPVGARVSGEVDWARRFDYMQQHTGEHILSGLVHSHFGFDNVGFHLGAEITTLDFNGVLTPEQLLQMETLANEAVFADLPVKTSFPSPDELATLSYRSKIALTGPVRIVEIPGIDLCACCAPHVDRTGQIGMIKVVDMQSHRGGVRLTLLCGSRALARCQAQQDCLSALSALLSAKPECITEAVLRLKEESNSRKERINDLQAKLLSLRLSSLPTDDPCAPVLLFEEEMDMKAVRDAVNTLTAERSGYCAIFVGGGDAGYSFILGSSGLDCNAAAAALRNELKAKCGGSAQMIQGSVAADRTAIRALLSHISESSPSA